jgi:acyl-coenzyme A synthetase/AMP-(fatty) acid ligase
MPSMLMGARRGTGNDRDHSVRFGFGAGVDPKLHAAFEARFGFPLVEAWAMTETGAGAVICANQLPRRVGESCLGKPGPELEVPDRRHDGWLCEQERTGRIAGPARGQTTRAAGSSPAISRTLKPPMRPGRTAGFIPAISFAAKPTDRCSLSTARRT